MVVGPLMVVDESEGFVEGGHDVVDLVLGGLGPLFDLGLLFADASLFGSQHVFGDGVAVVELDELLLLGGEFAQAAGMPLAFAAGDLRFVLDVLADECPDVLAFLNGEPVRFVNRVEPFLEQRQPDGVGLRAQPDP